MRMMNRLLLYICMVAVAVSLSGCAAGTVNTAETQKSTSAAAEEDAGRKTIRLIITSDLHGKMVPWDYATNEESPDGSLAQAASVIKEKRNDNSIVIDVGDIIQDNSAELFIDEPVHPMIMAMNAVGYDICTTGNHEYNYGMDTVKKVIASHKANVILSNVYDKDGKRLADPYVIEERDGVRIAFIGAVTPNIINWDKDNLKGYTVTNPVDELNAAVSEIKDKADIIVAVVHMDMNNELGTPGSGVEDIRRYCPEIDFICAGHGHNEIIDVDSEAATAVENKYQGQTVMVSDLFLVKKDGKWSLDNTATESVHTSDYEPDQEISELLEPYDRRAKDDAETVIGYLERGDISDPCDIPGIPNKFIADSEVLDFGCRVIQHYTGADVVARSPSRVNEEIKLGDIRKRDISKHYKYNNELYAFKMNGKQLKQWMEYNASFYNQTSPGDLIISFSDSRAYYTFTVFSGIKYEVNISKPEGDRIENLTWMDGRPVKEDDVFTVATTSYIADSVLSAPGVVYETDEEMPELISKNAAQASNAGSNDFKLLMIDYIKNVSSGAITPETDGNWKITGFNPDGEKLNKAIELIKAGKLKIEEAGKDRHLNVKPITEEMVDAFSER